MGCFSCCFSGSGTVKEDDVLLPWASVPANLQPAPPKQGSSGWWHAGGGSSGKAPAFGEGALREDMWAPQYQRHYKRRSGHLNYTALQDSIPPPQSAPAVRASSAPAASTRVPLAPAAPPAPTSSAGGWQSEPAYVREAALALAAEAAASKPPSGSSTGAGGGSKLGHLFGSRHHGSGENEDSAGMPRSMQARAGSGAARSRQRQHAGRAGQEQLLPRAPAFGEGALQKWH